MLSASKFLLKRSYTPGSVPLSSDLGDGELAINLVDKKIFFKNIYDQICYLEITPYSFISSLSSVLVIEGNNTVTGAFSQILGGYNNDVSGGGSSVINGENNDIEANFAFIINGLNNLILSGGDFGGIFAGQNNVLNHENSFILGSNISSHASNFTYVDNLSAKGTLYGDGSGLINLNAAAAPDTAVRSLTSNWQSTYTTVLNQSASWIGGGSSDYLPLSGGTLTGTILGNLSATGSFYGDGSKLTGIVAGDTVATTLVRSNSGYWESTYLTVSSLSANWQTTFSASSAYVSSNPTGITGASALTKLLQITQAGYNSITPASDTLYIIVG